MSPTIDSLSPRLRRLRCHNPGPFTGTGTNTYLVGHSRVAIIDPGPLDERHLHAILHAVRHATVVAVVVTHTHLDHSPLAARLKTLTGAPLYGYGPHGHGPFGSALSNRDLPSAFLSPSSLAQSGDLRFSPDVFFRDGEVIAEREFTLEAVFTPGHSANHLCLALHEDRALLCGDHVMVWSSPIIAPPDGKMSDYLSSLQKLLSREDHVYWPGHGPGKTNPHSLVRATYHHRILREQAILRAVSSGKKTLADITQKAYPNLTGALLAGASLSTLAHLEHLSEKGIVSSPRPEEWRLP